MVKPDPKMNRNPSDSNPVLQKIAGRSLNEQETQKLKDFLAANTAESNDDNKASTWLQQELGKIDFYLDQLSPENDTEWSGPLLDHNELDRLIGRLLSYDANDKFDAVIRAACEAHLREPIYRQSWNHSVCHNFEKYPAGLLASDKFLDLADRLVEQGAERTLRGDGCFHRIVGGVMDYNLDRVNPDNLHSEFAFKPKCLERADIQGTFGKWTIDYLLFCQAQTPYQYFMQHIEEALAHADNEEVSATVNFERLLLIRNNENAAKIDAYIARVYPAKGDNVSGKEAWVGYTRAVKSDPAPGVFVDVEGTILVSKWDKQENQVTTVLNEQLVQALDALCPSKEGVTIFTGGDPIYLTEQLRTLGFPERFLSVRSKADFHGQNLQILIDDTKPEIQGFHAEAYICPVSYENSDIEKLKELDPQGVLAMYTLTTEGRA